jgi:hypothetical protein
LVTDVSIYEQSYLQGFSTFYGNIENYVVLALLPSYLERTGSSLIYMVEDLIKKSNHAESGFYLHNYNELSEKLIALDNSGQNVLLIGVTYALLDLVERQKIQPKKHNYYGNRRNEGQKERNNSRRFTPNPPKWIWCFCYSFRIRND